MPVTIEAGKVAKPRVRSRGRASSTCGRSTREGAEPDSNAAVYTEFPNGESTTSYGEVKLYVPAGTTKIEVTHRRRQGRRRDRGRGRRARHQGHHRRRRPRHVSAVLRRGHAGRRRQSVHRDLRAPRRTSRATARASATAMDRTRSSTCCRATMWRWRASMRPRSRQPFTIKAGEAVDVDVHAQCRRAGDRRAATPTTSRCSAPRRTSRATACRSAAAMTSTVNAHAAGRRLPYRA